MSMYGVIDCVFFFVGCYCLLRSFRFGGGAGHGDTCPNVNDRTPDIGLRLRRRRRRRHRRIDALQRGDTRCTRLSALTFTFTAPPPPPPPATGHRSKSTHNLLFRCQPPPPPAYSSSRIVPKSICRSSSARSRIDIVHLNVPTRAAKWRNLCTGRANNNTKKLSNAGFCFPRACVLVGLCV